MDSRFPELDSLYREVVLDHYRSPRGKKVITDPDVENHGLNPVCGDECRVAIKLKDGRIADAAVVSRGCAISVASGSILAELLVGKSPQEVEDLVDAFRRILHGEKPPTDVDLGDLEALSGVKELPVRVKCALLAWHTLSDALKKRSARNGGGEPPEPSTTEHQE